LINNNSRSTYYISTILEKMMKKGYSLEIKVVLGNRKKLTYSFLD